MCCSCNLAIVLPFFMFVCKHRRSVTNMVQPGNNSCFTYQLFKFYIDLHDDFHCIHYQHQGVKSKFFYRFSSRRAVLIGINIKREKRKRIAGCSPHLILYFLMDSLRPTTSSSAVVRGRSYGYQGGLWNLLRYKLLFRMKLVHKIQAILLLVYR